MDATDIDLCTQPMIDLSPQTRALLYRCPLCDHRFALDETLNVELRNGGGCICLRCARRLDPELADILERLWYRRERHEAMRAMRADPADSGARCCDLS